MEPIGAQNLKTSQEKKNYNSSPFQYSELQPFEPRYEYGIKISR